MARTKTTNPDLRSLVNELENKGKEKDAPFLIDLSKNLSKSRKNRTKVNIAKMDRLVEESETIVVPGKVLGYGDLDKELTVAAFKFSSQAREKIESAGGRCLGIRELLEENPTGENVRIMK